MQALAQVQHGVTLSGEQRVDAHAGLGGHLPEAAPFQLVRDEYFTLMGWQFVERDGDWSILRKLFEGRWDADFLIVPPGHKIVARNDEEILDVKEQ